MGLSPIGYATYRLKILVNGRNSVLGIHFRTAATACKIWINDQELYAAGRVGTNAATTRGAYRPGVFFFDSGEKPIVITIQVANYQYCNGGLWRDINLGSQSEISKLWSNELNSTFFLLGLLLIMSIYHGMLFVIRKKELAPLFFGLFCFFIAVRVATTDTVILSWIFTTFDFEWLIRTEYVIVILAAYSFLYYLYSIFSDYITKNAVKILLTPGVIIVVGYLFLPIVVVTQLLFVMQIYIIIGGIYVVCSITKSIINKKKYAIETIFGILVLIFYFLYDMFASRYLVLGGYVFPAAVVVFIVIQSWILSHRYNDAFILIEDLSQNLEIKIQEKTRELQIANLKLAEDIDRERKLETMRKDFVSSVSHELRTPIALIQGYAEGLIRGINTAKDYDYYCGVILDESSKMARLLEDLLDLSRYDSGVFRLEKTEFSLDELIQAVCEKYQPIFQERDIRLESETTQTIIFADPIRIEQVLVNFLNNAIDHCEGEKRIGISLRKQSERVRVSVCNTGNQIPEDSLDKIWQRFYKTDPSRNRSYGGTGLGLAIVKAILELHDASYGVENVSGGVKFWFELGIG